MGFLKGNFRSRDAYPYPDPYLLGAVLRYSRGEEDAADSKGLQNMVSAKFELEGMLDLFHTLQQASGAKDGGGPDFMRSHPLTKDRIRRTEERIMKLRDRG